jgi:hypothetical protein
MTLVSLMTFAVLGMFSNSEQPEPQRKSDPLGLLYFLCNVHCTTFTVFLHYGFGSEALGFPGLFALILIFFSMAGDPLMVYWLLAFFVALVIQRIITFTLLGRGYELHSMNSGRPLLSKLLFMTVNHALVFEGICIFILGAVVADQSPFIGKFLMLGFVSLFIRSAIEESIYKRRLRKMKDAELEQRWLSEQFRGRGNGY